jgi:hypothetical protein
MSTSYIPYQPDQQYLLPCALQEWLPLWPTERTCMDLAGLNLLMDSATN